MTAPQPAPGICPSCKSKLLAPAATCPMCGADLIAGAPATPPAARPDVLQVTTPPAESRIPLGIIAGAVVAVLFGLVWAGIAALSGYELGIIAWAIGLGVGAVIIYIAKEHSHSLAVTASGLAIGGILLGKILTIYWAGPAMVLQEASKNKDRYEYAVAQAVIMDMMEKGELTAEETALFEKDGKDIAPTDEALVNGIRAKLEARLANLSASEKDALIKQFVRKQIAAEPIPSLIKEQFTVMDILWAVLAIASAWRICAPKK